MDTTTRLATLLSGTISSGSSGLDEETTAAVLSEAEKFADGFLREQAGARDQAGCRLVNGRVRTPDGIKAAWQAYSDGGWAGLTAPESAGGQQLSMTLASAVQERIDAADVSFGMLAINARCATRLLQNHGPQPLRDTWLPQLAAGKWAATICISEPQAGSDVGRIRTRAVESADGQWRVTGEKCWISYGDHDLTERIGHFALARTGDAADGTRGLSLFLVPDVLDDGARNGVSVMRLEEKLGLHASPTCALAFDDAAGYLVGEPGRGLPTLFAMIVSMRLGVAVQGAAIAQASADLASQYANDRRQGGPPDNPPVPIRHHAEVQRLLLATRVRAEAARLLALETASAIDASDNGDSNAMKLAGLLLPLAKTFAADAAFENANATIQVLGGAGYVNEWPAERMLRDSRIFSIYEGTSAIQGIDLLHRRVLGRDYPHSLQQLLEHVSPHSKLSRIVSDTASNLSSASPDAQSAAALPYLRLLSIAVTDGLLRRAAKRAGPLAQWYGELADYHGIESEARCAFLAARCQRGDISKRFERVDGAQPW